MQTGTHGCAAWLESHSLPRNPTHENPFPDARVGG